jgi:adhesin HecA-like repeat protein
VDLYAFEFELGFADPLILSATGVTEGPFLPSGGTTVFVAGTIDNSQGTVSPTGDTLIGLIPGVSGTGTLATITFDALTIGSTNITLFDVALLDSSLTPIDSNTVFRGRVEIRVDIVPEPATGVLVATGCLSLLALSWLLRMVAGSSR